MPDGGEDAFLIGLNMRGWFRWLARKSTNVSGASLPLVRKATAGAYLAPVFFREDLDGGESGRLRFGRMDIPKVRIDRRANGLWKLVPNVRNLVETTPLVVGAGKHLADRFPETWRIVAHRDLGRAALDPAVSRGVLDRHAALGPSISSSSR
jgi:hypothetical protein